MPHYKHIKVIWPPIVSIVSNGKSHSVSTELRSFIKNLQKIKQQNTKLSGKNNNH